jgi:hypothetical protein
MFIGFHLYEPWALKQGPQPSAMSNYCVLTAGLP